MACKTQLDDAISPANKTLVINFSASMNYKESILRVL